MVITPKSMWPAVKAMLHSVYDQPDTASVNAQFDRLLDYVGEKLPAVVEHLDAARRTFWPSRRSRRTCGPRSGPTTPPARLNSEIRRRTDSLGIFPTGQPS